MAVAASVSPATAGPLGTIEVGKTFPDLVLPYSSDGKPGSLAAFRGRKVVLHVFASW